MHNSLNGLPKRVVIDANVLMDAAFVSNGAARKSLAMLQKLGYSPVVDENIESEAIEKLGEYRAKYCLKIDLAKEFIGYISSNKVIRLPAAPQVSSSSVNKHDIHVLSAAAHYGAWVLTGDLALHLQLRLHSIQTRVPFDVIMEAAPTLTMENIIRIVAPTRESGMLFGRVVPGYWGGSKSSGHFTVCEMANVGRLFYDNATQEWVFDMPMGESVRVKCPLQHGEHWSVCGSYNLPGAGKPGKLSIRAGKHSADTFARSKTTTKIIASSTPGPSSFGSSVRNRDSWNGHLRCVVVGPQGMSNDSWKNIVAIPNSAPNPYDSGILERVLEQVGSLNLLHERMIRLPTEQDLRNLNF